MGRTTGALRAPVLGWAFQGGETLGGKVSRMVGGSMQCVQRWKQPLITEARMAERGTSRDGTRVVSMGQSLEDGDTGQVV